MQSGERMRGPRQLHGVTVKAWIAPPTEEGLREEQKVFPYKKLTEARGRWEMKGRELTADRRPKNGRQEKQQRQK